MHIEAQRGFAATSNRQNALGDTCTFQRPKYDRWLDLPSRAFKPQIPRGPKVVDGGMDDGSKPHEPRHHPPLHQDSGFDEPLLFEDELESSESDVSPVEVESQVRLPLLPLAGRGYRARPEEELLPRWAGCLIILVGFGWAVWCALYIPAMFEGAFGWKKA